MIPHRVPPPLIYPGLTLAQADAVREAIAERIRGGRVSEADTALLRGYALIPQRVIHDWDICADMWTIQVAA